jgi:hypothetical protein
MNSVPISLPSATSAELRTIQQTAPPARSLRRTIFEFMRRPFTTIERKRCTGETLRRVGAGRQSRERMLTDAELKAV